MLGPKGVAFDNDDEDLENGPISQIAELAFLTS